MTQAQYDNYLGYASALLKLRKIYQLESNDIVNDAVLYFLEKKKEYSDEEMRQKIKYIILDESLNKRNQMNNEKFSKHEIDRFCKKCQEVKPVACFPILTSRKYNVSFIGAYCKECQNKITQKNRKKQGVAYKEKNREYQKKWRDKNKVKRAQKSREMVNKEKAALSDKYITMRLKALKLDITPERIEEYRQLKLQGKRYAA